MREMKSLTLNDKTYDSFVDGVARPLAEASAIVCSASGTSISVADSSDHNLVGLHIYGKSTQAGTPTPAAPVDIVSVGEDGTIAVTVNSTEVEFVVPELRGVPVTDKTLATYTDSNGQMWCADEIDSERGVHVQRVVKIELTGTEEWERTSDNEYRTNFSSILPLGTFAGVLCSHYRPADNGVRNVHGTIIRGISGYQVFICDNTSGNDVTSFKNALAEKRNAGNPVTVYCRLAKPVETPLSEDAIEAYEALHTNKPSTTVTNDSGAYMSLEYVADARAYIDSRFASAILPATVE